jgi:hypothetical protein
MIEYLNDDTRPYIEEHNTIDTVIYGYEVDNACMLYEREHSKLEAAFILTNNIEDVSINEGLVRANTLNTLYDGQLDNYHMLEAGYESMVDTGKDVLLKIWNFIKNTVKGLINFIKNIYHKIVKFISGIFKDTKKQKKDIKKLEKEVNEREKNYSNIVSSSIGSGGGSGAAGIDTDSPTGDTNIDKKAETIHNTITDALNGGNDDVNKHHKVKNKVTEITEEYSVLTHLNTYYSVKVVDKYIEMLKILNMSNFSIILRSNKLCDSVIGNDRMEGNLSRLSNLLDVCSVNELEEEDLRVVYDPIINDFKDVIEEAKTVLHTISSQTHNENLDLFKSMIFKDEGYSDKEMLVITDISVNTIGYIKLLPSTTFTANDVLNIDDRIAILDNLLFTSITNGDNTVMYVPPEKELTLENLSMSVRSILEGYTYISDMIKYKRYTYKVRPDKEVKDTFFNNRSDIIYKDIKSHISKYMNINKSTVDNTDNIKDVILKKSGYSEIESKIIDEIGEAILNNTMLDKKIINSNILSLTNKIITDYNNIELNANRLSSSTMKANLQLVDDLLSLDNKLLSVLSVYIDSEIRS